MASSIDLPDINVWLAFSVADHPHHQPARCYWQDESQDRLAFCRVTALGLLRLSTYSVVMGGRPFTVPQAWQAYRAFRQLPEVVLLGEPDGCEPLLARWALDGEFNSSAWTNAYLAAFARTARCRVVSFDRGFSRFAELDFLQLTA